MASPHFRPGEVGAMTTLHKYGGLAELQAAQRLRKAVARASEEPDRFRTEVLDVQKGLHSTTQRMLNTLKFSSPFEMRKAQAERQLRKAAAIPERSSLITKRL